MSGPATLQVNAPQSMGTIPASGQNLTVSDSVVSLAAAAIPDKTKQVLIHVQDADVRMSTDGEDPSGTKGFIVYKDEHRYLSLRQANAAKFLRNGGSNAKIYSEALTY